MRQYLFKEWANSIIYQFPLLPSTIKKKSLLLILMKHIYETNIYDKK